GGRQARGGGRGGSGGWGPGWGAGGGGGGFSGGGGGGRPRLLALVGPGEGRPLLGPRRGRQRRRRRPVSPGTLRARGQVRHRAATGRARPPAGGRIVLDAGLTTSRARR